MHKTILSLLLAFSPLFSPVLPTDPVVAAGNAALYRELGLEGRASFAAFERGVEGFYKITDRRKNVLTLIDFSKPSTEERLWVIDLPGRKVLVSSHVAHGRGSGDNYATSFSNASGSHKSSPGFYLTGETYIGGNGYSLLINGLEEDINDNARSRAVVMHGATYADPSVIASAGRLGRSLGCPALPEAVNRTVIDAIKEGSVLYIHTDDPGYLSLSTII